MPLGTIVSMCTHLNNTRGLLKAFKNNQSYVCGSMNKDGLSRGQQTRDRQTKDRQSNFLSQTIIWVKKWSKNDKQNTFIGVLLGAYWVYTILS